MGRLACIDGTILKPEAATVSVYDRGFLYGDSVFETVRTYAGEPFALDEHMWRLERSAQRVAIDLPLTRQELALEVRRALRAAGNDESYVRVMLTRGAGPMGLDPALAGKPLRVILVEPLVLLPAAVYRDGVSVITTRTERASDAAHGAKVGNYLASLLALKSARAAGAHEALVVDAQGRVLEGTTSNVFLVRGGALVTPPEAAGILLGITRAHVLEVAAEMGIPVREELFTPHELTRADEAFLTSSLRELLPIVSVDGERVANGLPGPVTRAVHVAFRHHVGLAGAPMPWEQAVSKTWVD